MLVIEFSKENFIFFKEKTKKIKKINLGDRLNSKPEFYKKKFSNIIISHFVKLKKRNFGKIDKDIDFLLLNNFLEKNIWKNPEIVEILKTIALKDIIKKRKFSEVFVETKDNRINIFLQNILKKKIIIKNKKRLNFFSKNKYNGFFLFIKLIISFVKKVFFEIQFKKIKLSRFEEEELFITYSTIINSKSKNDFFWKKLALKNYEKSIKLIINMDDYSERKKSLILKNFNKKNSRYEFIESYQSIQTLSKTLITWLKMTLIFFSKDAENIKNPFINYFLKNSIISYSAVKDINLIYLLKEYFKVKKFKKVNYLFENLTWEKGLNKLLRNISEVHAYQHSSVRDWDLRYCPYDKELSFLKDYLPKKIYSNSLTSGKMLRKYFYTSKIFRAKKNRYYREKLITINDKKIIDRILIIGDIDMKETIDLKDLVLKNINNKFKLDLKLHPLNRDIKKEIDNVKLIEDDLEKLVKKYKFIICSNSTTSIYEVLQNKKIPFVYYNKNNLNLCPIKQLKNINYISSGDNVKNMVSGNYNKKFSFKKFKRLYV